MVDEDGIYHKRYIYDAYGNVSTKAGWGDSLDTLVADLNPFLYNGYYYDTETGFYYCNSRYYDPENSRFVNEDGYVSTGQGFLGYNMYAYCGNDPVNRKDATGEQSVAIAFVQSLFEMAKNEVQQSMLAAEEAAARASFSVSKRENSEEETIVIQIDTKDAIGSVDIIAYGRYYQKLYERSAEIATEKNVPHENLMSVFHISWEFHAHALGYKLGIEACDTTDLNVDETPFKMIRRTLKW